MARLKGDEGYSKIVNPYEDLYDSGEGTGEEELDENGNPIKLPDDYGDTIDDTDNQENIAQDGTSSDTTFGVNWENNPYFKGLLNDYNSVNMEKFNSNDYKFSDTNVNLSNNMNNNGYSMNTDYSNQFTTNITSKFGSHDNYGNQLDGNGNIVGGTNYGPGIDGGNPPNGAEIALEDGNAGQYSGETYDGYGNTVDADGNPTGDTNYSQDDPFGNLNNNGNGTIEDNANQINYDNPYSLDNQNNLLDEGGYGSSSQSLSWQSALDNQNNNQTNSANTSIVNPGFEQTNLLTEEGYGATNNFNNGQNNNQGNTLGAGGYGDYSIPQPNYNFGGQYNGQGEWITNDAQGINQDDGNLVPSMSEPGDPGWEDPYNFEEVG